MADNLDINNIHKELAKKDFIVFAGAGIVTGTGVPNSWKELLEKLAYEAGIEVDLEMVSIDEYPDKAQEIFDELCEQNKRQKYNQIIKELLIARESPWSEKAFEILLTTKGVVTTNYDDIFEASYKRLAEANRSLPPKVYSDSLPNFGYKDNFRQHKIIYLHGRANENYIVFKRDDYNVYYPTVCGQTNGDDCLERYIEYIYSEHTIVFVGFSFEDIYVRNHLKATYEKLVRRDQRCSDKISYRETVPYIEHYAFLPEIDSQDSNYQKRKAIEDELEKIKIRVINYEQRRDWMDCFEKVRKLRAPLEVKQIT